LCSTSELAEREEEEQGLAVNTVIAGMSQNFKKRGAIAAQ
jgi:hypothetical protein